MKGFAPKSQPSFLAVIRLLTQRPLLVAVCLLLGSLASSRGQTLNSQEQAIATYMTTNPSQGRPYMVLDPIIQGVAEARAKDMAVRNYFGHVNPDGVAANYLLRKAGYQLPAWWGTDPTANYVESIAAGYASPTDTWNAWMSSAPHKTHLLGLNSFFATETHYGIGYYYDANSTYKYYWVVITAPPQPVAITSPAPDSKVKSSSPSIPVAGTTDPAADAATVQFCIENPTGTTGWIAATGTTTWSGTAAGITPGPNAIIAESLDGSGNLLATATCNFTYVVTGTLTVTVSGSGSVTSAYAGVTTQDVGESLAIKATPGPGSIFTGWTGAIVSGSTKLKFEMQDDMSLQANFEPNPFGPVVGTYYGIVASGSDAESGIARISVTSNGRFTGRIIVSGSAYSFTGSLNADGVATVSIPRKGGQPLTLTIQADLTGGSGQITGTLSGESVSSTFAVSQATYNPHTHAAPQAGRYTLVLAPDPSITGSSTPQGNGFATIHVNTAGDALIAGRLADGTAFSATGRVANDGTLAIYTVPSGYRKGSSLDGLLTFSSTDISDIEGTLAWVKASNSKNAFYPAGFAVQLPSIGSRFVRPAAAELPMELTSGDATAMLNDGNLPQQLDVPVVISRAGHVTMVTPGQPDLALGINSVNGVVTGHLKVTDGSPAQPVAGVILQKQNSAFGYFRGVSQYGIFSLSPSS
jgi:uncharacterized protein YkwD